MKDIQKDFRAILRDANTGTNLLRLDAQQIGDPLFSAGFEGGGVASGSQACSIVVNNAYDMNNNPVRNLQDVLNPLEQEVIIEGHKWLLVSFHPSIRRKMGAGWANKPKTVYILNLE